MPSLTFACTEHSRRLQSCSPDRKMGSSPKMNRKTAYGSFQEKEIVAVGDDHPQVDDAHPPC